MTPRILAVIPARGGSKGVPRKNIREVAGKPLIAFTIETALAARHLFHGVIVSTDDPEIKEVSERYGAEVPFLRPPELATDTARTVPAIQHAVSFVEKRDRVQFDWVMVLQPTEPFRSVADLEAAIQLAVQGGCDSVISVTRVYAHHPVLMKRIEGNRLLPFVIEEREGTRRQDYDPPAFMRNGAVYLTKRDVLMETGSMWGAHIRPLVMDGDHGVSVDTEVDLATVAVLLEKRARQDAKPRNGVKL